MKSADILILNGTVITNNPSKTHIANGAVAIMGDTITAVGSSDELSTWSSGDILDAKGGIIMPGLINTHTHLPMSLFRGMADDLPLMTWLNEHMFPAENTFINPESVKTGTLLSCAEMILSGTTTCCGGYFLEHYVAEAVAESGIRAILGQGVIDYPAPGVPDPACNINHAITYAEKWLNKNQRITPSIFCHSPYTCSDQTLKKAKHAARDMNILFQIHVAETREEYDRIKADYHVTPIQHLEQLGILDEKTLLVHAIWVDDNDINIISGSGAAVSHNPESNMKLASGIAPVPKFLDAGITVGLGTDGSASNNDLDLFSEMDTTAKLHKVNMLDPTVMDACTVFKMATINGATSIGLDKLVGSLEPGKQADIIILDTRKPHMTPMYNPFSHIVYSARGSDVRDVIAGGKLLLKNREFISLDLDRILKEAGLTGQSIGKRHS